MAITAETFSHAASCYAAGQLDPAHELARGIVAADGRNAEAWRLLGAIALKRCDSAEGMRCLQRSLECNGGNPLTWITLAECQRLAGDRTAAVASYEQALRLRPDCAEARHGLGRTLCELGLRSKAFAAFQSALRLRPDDNEFAFPLADLLFEVGQPEPAAQHYRDILRRDPFHSVAAARLGACLVALGSFDEGIAQLRVSLTLEPDQPRVYFLLSNLAVEGWCRLTSDDLERIQKVVDSEAHSLSDRSECAFALGSILHRQGRHDEAIGHFHLANRLKKRLLQAQKNHFDARRHEAMVDRIIATYDRRYFERVRGWGVSSELPVFIVGMPRSGSTLVEQILASHPAVFGAGEAGNMQVFLKQFEPEAPFDPYAVPFFANREAAQQAGAAYVQWIGRPAHGAARATNKTLDNFLYLGVIATLFPQARIIHCRRHALDVCLSCYMTNFASADFPWSLEDIGAYHRAYEKLMAHWANVLPMPVKEVQYERLVDEPRPLTQDLIASCGLDWDERSLAFYKTRRVVSTCSTAQVRKPMYTHAVGRWRNYRAHLGPLFEALGWPAGEQNVLDPMRLAGTLSTPMCTAAEM